jgi:3-deoxy-D-manno-octulosonate 8-phosphate phosphatase (KDO 8-P phosphatase)
MLELGAWCLIPIMPKTSKQLSARCKPIKLFLCDVDGVLTDGSIFIGGEREFKRFNIRDGLGLVLARRAGLKVGWVSARPSLATKLRAEELKIDFLVQQTDSTGKTAAIEQLLAQERLNWSEVCFVGDDIIDLGPLARAGLAVAVGDAMAEAKAAAHWVTGAAGGRGAVREAVEMILKAQNKWQPFLKHYSA